MCVVRWCASGEIGCRIVWVLVDAMDATRTNMYKVICAMRTHKLARISQYYVLLD